MKSTAIFLFLVVVPTLLAHPQNAVDFSDRQRFNGKWMFDATKSDSKIKDLYRGEILEISYNDPELKMVRVQTRDNETRSATIILFTDNRGEKNRPYAFNDRFEIESKTLWAQNILGRTYAIKMYNSGKDVGRTTVRETYSLSKDGNSLIVIDESRTVISTDSRYGTLNTNDKGKSKRVYVRMK